MIASWVVSKEFKFEAAHRLPHHDGKCVRLHGHSWVARVFVRGFALHPGGPKTGMVLDYSDLKALVQPIVDRHLDHWYLNESLPEIESPTSEAIAEWLFNVVKTELATYGIGEHGSACELAAVEIDETCTSRCRFEIIR
jgi:6-pyruvoyltetrahydropterin/6-carboxytetrahydropterin synthase